MGSGFQIGRWFGISIRIDWSWLLIFTLVTWNLNTVLNQMHAALHPTTRLILAVLASLLFFASILAHEIAHALVARVQGVGVRRITLFFMGGVATLQREPPTARVELTTAVAGPLASFGLGGLLVLLGRGGLAAQNGPAAALVAQMAPVHTIVLWLGTVNLLLAAFNMIPAFPLDGGRALRAVFWALSGSLRKATRWATWIGQSIAWLMIALGAILLFGVSVPFIGSRFSSGLWLLFIGWFLNSASTHSYQQAALRDVLTGVSVLRLMRRDLPTVAPTCTLTNLVQDYVMSRNDQAFPVLDNQMLIGIVTLDDVRRVPREQWPTRRVEEIMTPQEQLETISPQEDASEALNKLIQRDVSHLPVVLDNCEFLGLLRRHDIVRWLQLNQEAIG